MTRIMHLAIDNQSDLDRLIGRIRSTSYGDLPNDHKQDLVRLLAQEHDARESIRFSKLETNR